MLWEQPSDFTERTVTKPSQILTSSREAVAAIIFPHTDENEKMKNRKKMKNKIWPSMKNFPLQPHRN
jgi:hypothetical protein